jgi:hypothetical protein
VVAVPGDAPTDDLLARLNSSDEVEVSGSFVRLAGDQATFLTNQIVARFVDGVDDATVAAVAARHELTPTGRFGDLSDVHRLRFDGPATYAVLDAANALAGEPEVLWSEPDFVHTMEDDAVIPTDYLFQEQWDHPILRTPEAWQILRDIDTERTFGSPDVISRSSTAGWTSLIRTSAAQSPAGSRRSTSGSTSPTWWRT